MPSARFLKQHTLALGGLLLLLLVCGPFLYRQWNPLVYHLTLTTGSFAGANYQLVTHYLAPAAHQQHIELSLVPTDGSENALDAVQQGRIQLALVDGGLSHEGRDNIREVAPLFLTALHLLVRRDIYDTLLENHDLRAALRGKTVSLSTVGSGTHTFARKILDRLGIPTSAFTETPCTIHQLVDEASTAAQIPAIVFTTSSLPSPVANRLVRDFGYRIYPLDFTSAVRLNDKAAYSVTIPIDTYSISPNVPDKDITTIGRRTLFVTHKDVPAEAIAQLARAVFEGDFAKAYDPPLTLDQFNLLAEFPRHPGAQAFVNSTLPITQETLQNLSQYIGLIGAIACIPPCIIMMRPYLRRLRRDPFRSVHDYLLQVSLLEARIFAIDSSGSDAHAILHDLRNQLNHLKREAMDLYHQERLDDADLIDTFLAQVGDLRSHLNACICHNHPPHVPSTSDHDNAHQNLSS